MNCDYVYNFILQIRLHKIIIIHLPKILDCLHGRLILMYVNKEIEKREELAPTFCNVLPLHFIGQEEPFPGSCTHRFYVGHV